MTKRLTILLVGLAVIATGLLTGCGKSGESVVAKVGDRTITTEDFNQFFRPANAGYESAQAEFDHRRAYLDSLIGTYLLIEAAYEKGIDKQEDVIRAVEANRDRFLLETLYLKHIADKVNVTDAQVREFYNNLAYQVRASHILLSTEDSAKAVLERLQAGENFDKLAFDLSMDPSARRNRGDLGYFTWGSMVDEFEEVAFSMEPGEVSPPVKTRFGYHIIKVVDKVPNQMRKDFKEMKEEIRRQLESKERYFLSEDYFNGIRKKYPFAIDTSVTDYVLRKREQLYPPQMLASIPRYDFDDSQLDRNERELVLATWAGGQVTLIEYLLKMREDIPMEMRPDFDNHAGLEAILFELMKQDILVYEAVQEGLEKSDAFNERLTQFKEFTMADIFRNDSLMQPGEPTEQELREYYEENKEEFATPPKIHVYEIQVSDELVARRLARQLTSLSQFKKTAAELTERPGMRAKGGDLGYIEEKWFPELFQAASKVLKGKVSGPVPMQGKYSVFMAVDRTGKSYQDFLDVKRDISSEITKKKRQEILDQWVKERKSITRIDINEDVLWETVNKEDYAALGVDTVETP